MKNRCKWPPSYDMTAVVSTPEVPRSASPGGHCASIEVQHEANAIHRAKLKLMEQLVVAYEVTANIAWEMSTQEEWFLDVMENLSSSLDQLSLPGSHCWLPSSCV